MWTRREASDGEGDEEKVGSYITKSDQQHDKDELSEVMRRVREGFDGRRNGGGGGARGQLRMAQLVGADKSCRKEAKRLGLLNEDEESSDDEKDGAAANGDDEEDVEASQNPSQKGSCSVSPRPFRNESHRDALGDAVTAREALFSMFSRARTSSRSATA